jgi:Fe-S-cluster containining protein
MDEQPTAPLESVPTSETVAIETVPVEFTLAVGAGQISVTAVVPAGQTNLTQILPVLQALDDSLIANVAAATAEVGHPVSCKAGCGACCRQLVPISIFEAEALALWIRSLPESTRQELAERFHQALLKLSAAGLIDRLVQMSKEDWRSESEQIQSMGLDYLYQRVPCPFLVDESCSIHPIRPLICREYLVSSPPANCFDPGVLKVAPVHLPVKLFPTLTQIGAELEHDTRGWIPLVFLFAWKKTNSHPGQFISGTGPEVLYEFVKRMATPPPPEQPQAP